MKKNRTSHRARVGARRRKRRRSKKQRGGSRRNRRRRSRRNRRRNRRRSRMQRGGWQCPNCRNPNFSQQNPCPRCGHPVQPGEPGVVEALGEAIAATVGHNAAWRQQKALLAAKEDAYVRARSYRIVLPQPCPEIIWFRQPGAAAGVAPQPLLPGGGGAGPQEGDGGGGGGAAGGGGGGGEYGPGGALYFTFREEFHGQVPTMRFTPGLTEAQRNAQQAHDAALQAGQQPAAAMAAAVAAFPDPPTAAVAWAAERHAQRRYVARLNPGQRAHVQQLATAASAGALPRVYPELHGQAALPANPMGPPPEGSIYAVGADLPPSQTPGQCRFCGATGPPHNLRDHEWNCPQNPRNSHDRWSAPPNWRPGDPLD